jgi:Crinkler effector protein N-terminal domain
MAENENILLFCSILGPDVERYFSVKISRNEYIDQLKFMVKEEQCLGLAHNRLDIWKAREPPLSTVSTIADIWRHVCSFRTPP